MKTMDSFPVFEKVLQTSIEKLFGNLNAISHLVVCLELILTIIDHFDYYEVVPEEKMFHSTRKTPPPACLKEFYRFFQSSSFFYGNYIPCIFVFLKLLYEFLNRKEQFDFIETTNCKKVKIFFLK